MRINEFSKETIEIDLKRLKKTGVDMIKEFKVILEENGVEFWIEYGTMLGAVRNGEMIPWDSEFDFGLLRDSFTNQDKVICQLIQAGYSISHAPDRLKILKKGWEIGAFSIDLHLYRVDKEEAVVSYAEPEKSILRKLFHRLLWILSLYSPEKEVIYRYADIMKLLAERFDIFDDSAYPRKVLFRKHKLSFLRMFAVSGDDFVLQRTLADQGTSIMTNLAIGIVRFLPLSFVAHFRKLVIKISPKTKYKRLEQKIPLHFFTNLDKVELCGMQFNAPKEKELYLELIYGKNWRKPNLHWRREDMGIIKKEYGTT